MLLPCSWWVPCCLASCFMFIFYYIALRHPCLVICFMMWCCLCHLCCICIMIIIVVCIFIVCIFVVGLLYLWTPSPHLLCCSIFPFHLNHHQVQHPMTSFFLSILTHLLQVAFSYPSKMFTYFLWILHHAYTLSAKLQILWGCFGWVKKWLKFEFFQTWIIFLPLKIAKSIYSNPA